MSNKSFFKQNKISLKKLFYDWKFIYKLLSFFLLLTCFIIGIVYGVFIEYWYVSLNNPINIPRTYNLNVMISFWSVQTNALALVYFFFSLIYHDREKEHKITNFYSLLNITVYITLTMLLFWILIFYGLGTREIEQFEFSTKMNAIITIFTHAVTPVLAIGYLFISLGFTKINVKQYLLKKIWITLIFPVTYLVFINLRAILLSADGVLDNNYLFPYPFIDFQVPIFPLPRVTNNILIVIIGISMIIFLCLLTIVLNNFINKKFFITKKAERKKEIIESNVLIKEIEII